MGWITDKSKLAASAVKHVKQGQRLTAVAANLTRSNYTGPAPYLAAQQLELDILRAWMDSLQ